MEIPIPDSQSPKPQNLRRVAAGMINGRLRRPWRPEDKANFRAHCLRRRPWEESTGPRTEEGKERVKANGLLVQRQPGSRRQVKAEVADVTRLIADVSALCGRVDRSIGAVSSADPPDCTGDGPAQ